ncbi:MAG: DUF748 domain-containing protein [Pseudomonadota bacterium]
MRVVPVRRLILATAVAAALLLSYALLGFFLVPRLLHNAAVDTVRERMGRQLALGEIRFNPFTLELEINDLQLPDDDGGVLLGFKRLLVNAELASLWNRGAVLSNLEIDQPTVAATLRPGGGLNLADLGKLAGPPDPAPEAAAAGRPLRLRIDRLAMSAGAARFRDQSRARPFEARLQSVGFELRAFSTFASTDNAYHFQARSAAGESLDWRGDIFLAPLRSKGQFSITGLTAATIQSYLGDSLPLFMSSGQVDLRGGYELAASNGPTRIVASLDALDIRDLGLRPVQAQRDYVHLDQVSVTAVQANLVERSVSVGAIRVMGGQVDSWLSPDGKLNLLELAGTPAPAAANAPTDATLAATSAPGVAAPAWRYTAADIGIAGLRVIATDQSTSPNATLKLSDIALIATGFSSDQTQAVKVRLGFKVNDSGELNSDVELRLDTLAAKGTLKLANLDITALQPYVDSSTDMTLKSGLLDAQIDIDRSADKVLLAKGNASLRKLRGIDNPLQQDFLRWDSLQVRGIDYRSTPQRVRIQEINVRAPYARVIVGGDQTLNLTHILNPPGYKPPVDEEAKVAPPKAAPAPVLDLAIARVRIERGSANFADLWIKPNFAVGIQGLSGTIVGLSADPRSRAKVDLKGTVDRYAPAIISGEVNPLAATAYSDITMSFHNMEMTTVTPYSGHFAGYKIEKGKLSVDLSYKIDDRKLNAGHRFVIDQLQLGEKVESKDATSLPVRLAVALLKDRNGIIDINLPITGTLDDPKFRVGPLIWKAIVNLIVKAATAPFALLGSLFGGGDEINQIVFVPGSATLEAAAQERVQSLRKGLIDRPGLQLDVPAGFAPEQDRSALLQTRYAALLAENGIAAPSAAAAPPADRYKPLLVLLRKQAGKDVALPPLTAAYEADRKRQRSEPPPAEAVAELDAALQAPIAVGDTELAELGHARAAAIQDLLLADGAIDPARVFIINAPAAGADSTQVRLDLALK